jgi:aspartate kinase
MLLLQSVKRFMPDLATTMPNLVVMKFGGTSVEDATAMARTAEIVRGRVAKGFQVVTVVSAMARVTDQLIAAAGAAGRSDRIGALAINARLRSRHVDTSRQLLGYTDAFRHLELQIHSEFDALDELLRGIAAVGELTPRTQDQVLSYGERLSSRIVAAAFSSTELDAAHVDARTCIITDATFGKALPQDALTAASLEKHVRPLLNASRIPVMGGYIGATVEHVTTTLGRGGSDYTAAIVGGVLGAKAIEIWTDVDGVMTSDPRICPDALRVKYLSFEEAAELAYFGAKVLHPSTILPAVQKNIPVYVLNSRNPESEGTRITAVAPPCLSPFKSIAAKRKLTIIDLVASRMLMSHGYMRAIFEIFDRHKCPVDMVSTSEVSVSLTVDSTVKLPEIAAELSKLGDVKYEGRKALICLVGEYLRGHLGVAGRVFTAVSHINVRMISQGASEINLSFMIDEDEVDEALRSLHEHFFADADPEIFDVVAKATTAATGAK